MQIIKKKKTTFHSNTVLKTKTAKIVKIYTFSKFYWIVKGWEKNLEKQIQQTFISNLANYLTFLHRLKAYKNNKIRIFIFFDLLNGYILSQFR